jgi:hypothetical protein
VLATVGLLSRFIDAGWDDIVVSFHSLTTSNAELLIATLGLEAAWLWSLAQVYRSSLVAMGGSVTRTQAVRVSMGAFTISRIVPGGGAVGSVFAARELVIIGNPATTTVASMVVSWWISMSSLTTLVLGGIGIGVLAGQVSPVYLITPAVTLAALAAAGTAVATGLRRPRLRAWLVALAQRVAAKTGTLDDPAQADDAFQKAIQRVRDPRSLLHVALWGTASWSFDAAALWLMFEAFGHRLPIAPLLVGYGAVNLLQALPELTPGWLGVIEGTLAVTYAAFGIPTGVAVIAVLSYRMVSHWLPVAVGLPPAIGMLRRSSNPRARRGRAA